MPFRRFALALLLASSLTAPAFAASSSGAPLPASGAKAKTIVLVHGAFADGSSWAKVTAILQKAGYTVIGVQNPLTSLADDVAATKRALAQAQGPVVLVGHSWGGVVISEAGADANVAALVYVAAMAPQVGEDIGAAAAAYPKPPGQNAIRADKDGFLTLDPAKFPEVFAGDVKPKEAAVMAALQGPLAASAFASKTTVAAWTGKPNWYVVASADQMLPPELERAQAERMKATIVTVKSSHAVLVSHAAKVARTISEAATQIGG